MLQHLPHAWKDARQNAQSLVFNGKTGDFCYYLDHRQFALPVNLPSIISIGSSAQQTSAEVT